MANEIRAFFFREPRDLADLAVVCVGKTHRHCSRTGRCVHSFKARPGPVSRFHSCREYRIRITALHGYTPRRARIIRAMKREEKLAKANFE